MRVEDEYTDVLQNIELGIVMTYRDHPDMLDYDVMRTLEAVMDSYKAEKIGRNPRDFRLSQTETRLFQAMRHMCEWRLGRRSLGESPEGEVHKPTLITVDVMLLCLKRLLKSVKTWNHSGGRQGYLKFIIQYVH